MEDGGEGHARGMVTGIISRITNSFVVYVHQTLQKTIREKDGEEKEGAHFDICQQQHP